VARTLSVPHTWQGLPESLGDATGQELGRDRQVVILTISHMDWAGMQESQCTRDSVDCGKVLGTL
jgi:hypothetical protein